MLYVYFCRQNVPDEDFQLGEVDATIAGTSLEHACDQFPFCPSEATRYRNIDGKCNSANPQRGAWGAAGSPMYVNVITHSLIIFFQKEKLSFYYKPFLRYFFFLSGNDCYHQATRMVFGDHGRIIKLN